LSLHTELEAAGLTVKTVTGWGTRGGKWALSKPVAVMEHHTAPPVPYPVNGLYGDLLKANINTKPDGTVWLIAQGACNYSSGAGSSVVLSEARAGQPPTANARERGLVDDTGGNAYFFNFENDHAGDGGPLPQVQYDAIVTATRVVLIHYGLGPGNVISHAEWTTRKRDPYWNGSLRTIETIRQQLEADMPSIEEIRQIIREETGPSVWGFKVFPAAGVETDMRNLSARTYNNTQEIVLAHRAGSLGTTAFAEIDDDDLQDLANAAADEIDRRARERLAT
jgi:hypothetical protein